jgi:hypothetical protein
MNHPINRDRPESMRWTQVLYDVNGIDADIEKLMRQFREKHGYSREVASSELVRRLSFATV